MDRVSNVTYRFNGDATGYVDSVMQVERANARATASGERLASSGRLVNDSLRGQEVRLTQSSQSFNRFAQSIDPALRNQARLTAGTERLSRALDEGKVSIIEHDRLLGLLAKKYADVEPGQSGAVSGFGRIAAAAAAGAAAYYTVTRAVGAYIEATDQAKRIESQLRLVTDSSAELNRVSSELFASAQRNRTGFEETASLYARVARNADQLGISQRQVANLSDSVAKAIRISGASASESSAGVIQFGQALASGRLSGDEFRSVMENTPRLALALADGLGVTIGQLRTMANEQRLTADVVIPALLSQTGKLRDEFGKMNVTVAESRTVFENSLSAAIARLDDATGASRGLTNGILGIAAAIDALSGRKLTIDEQINGVEKRLRDARAGGGGKSALEYSSFRNIGFDTDEQRLAKELSALRAQRSAQVNFQDTRDFLGRTAGTAVEALRASPLGGSLFAGERSRRAEDAKKLGEESAKASSKVIEGLQRELDLAKMSASERRIELKARQAVADLGDKVTEADRARVEAFARASESQRIAAERTERSSAKSRQDQERSGARQARQLNDYLTGLETAVRLNALSADARREEEAVMRGMALAGDKISAADRARLDERIRLTYREGEIARKQREDLETLERQMQDNRLRAIEQERQARETMMRDIEGEFRDLWASISRSGESGLGGLLDNLKGRVLSFASDAAFDTVVRPLAQDLGRLFAGPDRFGPANDNTFGGVSAPLASLAKSAERLAPDFDDLNDRLSVLGRTTSNAARQTGAFGDRLQSVWGGVGVASGQGGPTDAAPRATGVGGALNELLGSNGLTGALDRLGDRLGWQNSATLTRNAGRVPYANPEGLFGGSSSLGGVVGGGFAGASIGASMTGIFGRTGPGSTIGGALGGAAGMAIGGPIGAAIGSVAGSLIGSAFGPRPSNAGASVEFDRFGRAGAASGAKATDQTRGLASQTAGLLTSALDELRRDDVVRLDRSLRTIGIGTRDRSAYVLDDGVTRYAGSRSDPSDLANTVLRELLKSAKSESADVAQILRREFASTEEFTAAFRFTRDTYSAIVDARPALTQVEQAMKDLSMRFSEARRESERLGLSLTRFDSGAAKSFDSSIRDALRQLTDPVGLAQDEFERGALARIETAKKLGGDMVQVERLNALERAAIVKQATTESFGGLRSLVDEIRFGSGSAAAPEQRYFDAMSRYNAARRDALTNRDQTSIQEFESVSRSSLGVARDFLGTSERLNDFQNDIVATASTLSGGLSDPAGIGRTNGQDLKPVLETLTRQAALQLQQMQSGDGATVAAIQTLISEMQRLNAMLAAMVNRAA